MNRLTPTLAIALLATAGFTSPAWAADKAAKQSSGNATQMSDQGSASQGSQAVRNWGEVDKNNDNLIQPEEMEAALKEVGPQAKKSSQ